MSLINEALKKAQRVRHDGPAEPLAPVAAAGAPRIAKRERAKSPATMLLIGGGVLVLIAASVVATIFLVNRPAAPAPAPVAAATPKAAPAPAALTLTPASAPAPVIPVTEPPAPASMATAATTPAPTAAPTVTVPLIRPAVTATEPASTPSIAPAPAAAKPAFTVPVITAAPPPPPPPDERTAAFVESIRVAGIRSHGPEGRVLMNDRVYKLNDVVDRGLSLRLTVISAGSLTFTDPNGVTYVKNF